MAEERVMDLDKNKKYRIRRNADGEEELYFAGEESEEEEEVEVVAPDNVYDEALAEMTNEQVQEVMKQREEEQERIQNLVRSLTEQARASLAEKHYAEAYDATTEGLSYAEGDHDLTLLRFRAAVHDFADGYDLSVASSLAEKLKDTLTEEERTLLSSLAGDTVSDRISSLQPQVEALKKENESKKEERRQTFNEQKKTATKRFAVSGVVTGILLILVIVFLSVMFSVQTPVYVVLAIVFGVLTLPGLVLVVLNARSFAAACDKCKRNESNTSTKLGREYEARALELAQLNAIQTLL